MSGDQLNLDALEHTFRRAEEYGLGVNPQQALEVVAEVRRLREELDRLHAERENIRAIAAQPGLTPNGHRWT